MSVSNEEEISDTLEEKENIPNKVNNKINKKKSFVNRDSKNELLK